ncbi:hypothetical protein HPB52_010914 [Rhipicephalus sanguineus]|uniref:Uncharacterized protein n=1 Tax=Rhipicephalus sanguineus TaxID=34632 RepID=A0A9D4PQV4_RHISA|nr:hypothetical protein HPB52_010914 [Rhipicephalus sanguineus]
MEVIPCLHGLSHNLKNTAKRQAIQVVRSAPLKGRMVRRRDNNDKVETRCELLLCIHAENGEVCKNAYLWGYEAPLAECVDGYRCDPDTGKCRLASQINWHPFDN